MKLFELLTEDNECEVVYCDEDGNELLDEAAIRQFKKQGSSIVKKFRCLSGPKAGRLVSSPSSCGMRKDPAKVRQGRKVMRQKGAIIQRKTAISKNKAVSKQVANLNKRLSGK